MASTSGFGGFKRIHVTSLKKIADLTPHAGKNLLAEELGIPPYIDSQDMQKAPFVSFIYDSIMFGVEKGFPWEHISLIVKVAHDFLKKILVERHQISDAIKDFKEESKNLEPLSDRHKKQFTDYIFETVLCHYNLYKYVFSHLRDIVHPELDKDVNVPETPPPLKEGKSMNVWEYEEKLKAISDDQNREKDESYQFCQEFQSDTKTMGDLDDVPVPYSKMALTDLVKDILHGYTAAKEKEMEDVVIETTRDLEYKLKKTVLPRPPVLGSPPRFKPKNLIAANASGTTSNNNNNSLKPEKRSAKSGRSSAASNMSKK